MARSLSEAFHMGEGRGHLRSCSARGRDILVSMRMKNFLFSFCVCAHDLGKHRSRVRGESYLFASRLALQWYCTKQPLVTTAARLLYATARVVEPKEGTEMNKCFEFCGIKSLKNKKVLVGRVQAVRTVTRHAALYIVSGWRSPNTWRRRSMVV